jgi:hypothetical protein
MRTKFVLAILLGMIGGTLRSSPLSAGQVGIPGVGCRIVNSVTQAEATGTTFFGPDVTNNSSSSLTVYCPVSLNTSSNPRTLKAYGNSKALQGVNCNFYYATSPTSFTNVVGTNFGLPNGIDRECDITLPTTPPISNGAFTATMGPNGSYFYDIVVNTQF